MLTLIGIGLCDGKDLTLRGIDAIEQADKVYLEGYTSLLQCSHEELEALVSKEITLLSRQDVESGIDAILEQAKEGKVAILVIGDVFGATTHADLYLRAAAKGIRVTVIHNASIVNAVGEVGLELYRFGRIISIPYWSESFEPTSFLDHLKENHDAKLHTLCLLDIKADERRFMSVSEGLGLLHDAESRKRYGIVNDETLVVGVARLGCDDRTIVAGPLAEIAKVDFGLPPHCIIIPGRLHPVEEEMLALWRAKK